MYLWRILTVAAQQQFLSPLVRYSYHDEKLLFGTELTDKINSAKSGGMFLHFRNLPGYLQYCQGYLLAKASLGDLEPGIYAVLSFSGGGYIECSRLRVIQFKVKGKLRDMCFKTC